MTIYLEVITSPNCPHSPRAVRLAQNVLKEMHGVAFQEVSMITSQGMQIAQAYGVNATPAIVLNGRISFVGVPAKKVLQKMLDEELKKETEKNSYFF
ncbi:hypothetical protein COV61_01885 [Candidatus Micrarchaeota archaeon CG11_big_fil_rev_8_21_14_0_20_47_5]|nr:MAG: hypothetical protein AUJ17_05430 [Candidatus Micrarchaeota archaeon CG1_02_47_40]PIN83857.1 MAG: hypothetical protein COV61_01885 [Candidatus Micrarchaeota archaeon CG11_big_fil_rev_8_21_14_0_20_47_5]